MSKYDTMNQLTRKQREIERRTKEILAVARPILLQEGFQTLSMDRVAAQMEYAKGTIYNHFPNKEEIVLALAVHGMKLRRALFCRAVEQPGSSRHRLACVGAACEFFVGNCFDDFRIEQLLRQFNIWDKSSELRQNTIREYETSCIGLVSTIVQSAIASGDVVPPPGMSPAEMVFGFWAICYGSQVLAHSSPSLKDVGIRDFDLTTRTHLNSLCNGFDWQPLMNWQDHNDLMNTIHQQLDSDFQNILSTMSEELL